MAGVRRARGRRRWVVVRSVQPKSRMGAIHSISRVDTTYYVDRRQHCNVDQHCESPRSTHSHCIVGGLIAGCRLRTTFTREHKFLVAASAAWLGATAALLIAQKAMFRAHVSNLVVPAIVLCALVRNSAVLESVARFKRGAQAGTPVRKPTPIRAIAITCVVLGAIVVQFGGLLRPGHYSTQEQAAVDTLRMLPRDAFVVTDEPGLAWQANRKIPSWLVDPGIKRFFGDDLKVGPRSVYAAIQDTRVCAVVIWTFRYGSKLPSLTNKLELNGFTPAGQYGRWTAPDESRGPRQVWMRQWCPTLALLTR